jgi:hypothetical protein
MSLFPKSYDAQLQEQERKSSEDHFRHVRKIIDRKTDGAHSVGRALAVQVVSQRLEFKPKD